ncbi:hypothetical protein MMC10_003403 [Thelotrema lepadinum]|nr:hypothetical protein [Thelotrema lepadinum]
MAATQLGFTLRTSSNCKTVHLLGSWDGYKGQLPLSRDSSKAGSWKGTFRFQGSTLQTGKRYWYYYIMDGYHVSHDPAKPFTKEPTTGRSLNILDVPKSGSGGGSVPAPPLSFQSKRSQMSVEIPTGRGLSPSRIIHPKPSKPYASRGIREADYSRSPVDEITSGMDKASLYDSYMVEALRHHFHRSQTGREAHAGAIASVSQGRAKRFDWTVAEAGVATRMTARVHLSIRQTTNPSRDPNRESKKFAPSRRHPWVLADDEA